MNSVPTGVLAHLCSFVHVRAVVQLLDLVLRRRDIRVPWPVLDGSVLYLPTRAILPSLRMFTAEISPKCLPVIQPVLYAAAGLETLVLSALGRSHAAMLADLVAPGPLPASEVVVNFVMNHRHDNAYLDMFVRAFPRARKLALHFQGSYYEATAALDLAFEPGRLRVVEITGAVLLDPRTVESIATCSLSRLLLDVAEPCRYALFVDMRTLTELRLDNVDQVSDVAFVQHLTLLRSLALGFNSSTADTGLVLPPSLRELRCFCENGGQKEFELDHGIEFASPRGPEGGLRTVALSSQNLLWCEKSGLLDTVRSLSCEVVPDDVQTLIYLLPGLKELRSLELTNLGSDVTNTLSGLAAGPALPVTKLDLTGVDRDDELAWVGPLCPDLVELGFQRESRYGLTDSALARLFRVCPKLASLVERSAQGDSLVVTVGRRSDGTLIKRSRDLSVVLEH